MKTDDIALVSEFILSIKKGASFLPYSDYNVIEKWLDIVSDVEVLLSVLSDILPAYFDNVDNRNKTLPAISVKVCKSLKGRQGI